MMRKADPVSITRQAELLGLSRSSLYYEPVGVSETDLLLMATMDDLHLKFPFYGSRRLLDELLGLGFVVGRDHVRTLMRRMGLDD